MPSPPKLIALLLCIVAILSICSIASTHAKSIRGAHSQSIVNSDTFFSDWRSTKQLLDFLDHLGKVHKAKTHDQPQISVTSIGKSAEKRLLKLISIGPNKPRHQIFLQGTVHGREWISPASLCFLASELASGRLAMELEPKLAQVLEETTVHILPLLNPDGYEYTRSALQPGSKNSDATRLWRKNRRNLCLNCERAAHGIDLNRNWGVKGVTFGFGATRSTSDAFQGKNPFSEPELKAMRTWLVGKDGKDTGNGKNVDFFLDVHCCSAAILPPTYYHSETEEVKKHDLEIAQRIAQAMKSVNGARYSFRERETTFSNTNSGIAVDYIHGEAHAKHAFIVETRGNDKSRKMEDIFVMEPRQIVPVSQEVKAAFVQVLSELLRTRGSTDLNLQLESGDVLQTTKSEVDISNMNDASLEGLNELSGSNGNELKEVKQQQQHEDEGGISNPHTDVAQLETDSTIRQDAAIRNQKSDMSPKDDAINVNDADSNIGGGSTDVEDAYGDNLNQLLSELGGVDVSGFDDDKLPESNKVEQERDVMLRQLPGGGDQGSSGMLKQHTNEEKIYQHDTNSVLAQEDDDEGYAEDENSRNNNDIINGDIISGNNNNINSENSNAKISTDSTEHDDSNDEDEDESAYAEVSDVDVNVGSDTEQESSHISMTEHDEIVTQTRTVLEKGTTSPVALHRLNEEVADLNDVLGLFDSDLNSPHSTASLEDMMNSEGIEDSGQSLDSLVDLSSGTGHTESVYRGNIQDTAHGDIDITRWADELLGPSAGDAVATGLTTGIVRERMSTSHMLGVNDADVRGGGDEREVERQVLYNAEELLGPSVNSKLHSTVYPPRFDIHMWSSKGSKKSKMGGNEWFATVGFLLGVVFISASVTGASMLVRAMYRKGRKRRNDKGKVASHEL